MLMNMPTKKKKEAEVKLDDDAVLGDILGQIRPKLPVAAKKATPLLSSRPTTATASAVPRPSEERNPFLQRGTGLKKTVLLPSAAAASPAVASKNVDTMVAAAESDPSQVIEEFESCPMDGFEDDMIVDDDLGE